MASVLASLVDELGTLERELSPLRGKLARVEMLRKALRNHYEGKPPDQPFECAGERFVALIGPRAEQRIIDFAALAKAIGLKEYARIATVTLGALEANAACTVVASVVSSEPVGPRPVKVIERGTAG